MFFLQIFHSQPPAVYQAFDPLATPAKFNIDPEKWWLEDYLPIGKVTFQGVCYTSGGYNLKIVKWQVGGFYLSFSNSTTLGPVAYIHINLKEPSNSLATENTNQKFQSAWWGSWNFTTHHETLKGIPIALKLHPWSLTWNLKIDPWKRKFLLETIIFRFHVNLWECMLQKILEPETSMTATLKCLWLMPKHHEKFRCIISWNKGFTTAMIFPAFVSHHFYFLPNSVSHHFWQKFRFPKLHTHPFRFFFPDKNAVFGEFFLPLGTDPTCYTCDRQPGWCYDGESTESSGAGMESIISWYSF